MRGDARHQAYRLTSEPASCLACDPPGPAHVFDVFPWLAARLPVVAFPPSDLIATNDRASGEPESDPVPHGGSPTALAVAETRPRAVCACLQPLCPRVPSARPSMNARSALPSTKTPSEDPLASSLSDLPPTGALSTALVKKTHSAHPAKFAEQAAKTPAGPGASLASSVQSHLAADVEVSPFALHPSTGRPGRSAQDPSSQEDDAHLPSPPSQSIPHQRLHRSHVGSASPTLPRPRAG